MPGTMSMATPRSLLIATIASAEQLKVDHNPGALGTVPQRWNRLGCGRTLAKTAVSLDGGPTANSKAERVGTPWSSARSHHGRLDTLEPNEEIAYRCMRGSGPLQDRDCTVAYA